MRDWWRGPACLVAARDVFCVRMEMEWGACAQRNPEIFTKKRYANMGAEGGLASATTFQGVEVIGPRML